MSDTKEGYIPGHGHQRVPEVGQRDVATDGYIHFPKIIQLKLEQQPKQYAHPKTKMKLLIHKLASKKGQDLKHAKFQLLSGAVLINGMRLQLPITKEYILEEYHDVFSGVGTLSRRDYHITLKDYVPVQHCPRSVLIKIKIAYKKELQ